MKLLDLQAKQCTLRPHPIFSWLAAIPAKRIVQKVLLVILSAAFAVVVGPLVLLTILHASSLLIQIVVELCQTCFSVFCILGM